MKRYDPKSIEPKWQQVWADTKLYAARDDDPREKYYYLVEFPYPSGDGLHVGHVLSYTALDIMARHKRMQGFNVLYPMGFDEFGLPTENYAIKHKIAPQVATEKNVSNFRRQFKSLGLSFDWDREVRTSDPNYYKWTQWIFLQLYKKGLAYQAEIAINWCPFEKTGLANEEVVDGKHERCGTPVERKLLKQWVLAITKYADRLADDLKTVDYLDRVATQQINWIGRSEGAEITWAVQTGHESKDSLKFTPELTKLVLTGEKTNTIRLEPKQLEVGDYATLITRSSPNETRPFAQAKIINIEKRRLQDIPLDFPGHEPFVSRQDQLAAYREYYGSTVMPETEFTIYHFNSVRPYISVYTTRPDTIFGATFLVISPELANTWLEAGWEPAAKVRNYIEQSLNKTELSRQEDRTKTGADTGITAVHPLTGQPVPVWVADYVLGSYGTGAIMAVPAHDERDHDFAITFKLPITPVVAQEFGKPLPGPTDVEGSVIIGYDPAAKRYLSLQNHTTGHAWLPSGGRDGKESFADAARRELAEEAGYHEVKELIQLGDPVYSYYHNANKQSNRRSLGYNFLAILDSTQAVKPSHETHEKFTPQWSSFGDLYTALTKTAGGSDHWLDALNKARQAIERHEQTGAYTVDLFTGNGPLINSGQFNGLSGAEAKHAIIKALFDKGVGKGATKYKLRDWIFSRQHYWGEPIPIIHCPKDGAVAVPEDQLPVTLPEVEHYEPTDTGESPLAAIPQFVNTTCPQCGGPAGRETDTMPNWAGSSWYYLRYADPHNDHAFASPEALGQWTPVDLYNGGMEHTTLHLLYSRFWHKFLYDQGLVPTPEPYAKRTSHGMILGPDNQKMSKSRGNVINPDHVVDQYGADTIRLYEMFMGPFDEQKTWSEDHLAGVSRFLYRVWVLAQDLIPNRTPSGETVDGILVTAVDRATHKTIKRVHDNIGAMSFNLMVSSLMEYINFLTEAKTKAAIMSPAHADLAQRTVKTLILMLAPSAPHMAEELWEQLGEQGSVHQAAWPAYDPALLKDDIITVVAQVNGKVRAQLALAADASEADITAAAQADPKVASYLEGQTLIKTIVVPRKLVNFVVKPSAK